VLYALWVIYTLVKAIIQIWQPSYQQRIKRRSSGAISKHNPLGRLAYYRLFPLRASSRGIRYQPGFLLLLAFTAIQANKTD
jgi:hypothetical protein